MPEVFSLNEVHQHGGFYFKVDYDRSRDENEQYYALVSRTNKPFDGRGISKYYRNPTDTIRETKSLIDQNLIEKFLYDLSA